MKIAIVLNTSWNVYNFRMGLIRELQNTGHEVQVYAPRDQFSDLLIKEGCTYIPVRLDSRGANPFKDSALIVELAMLYRKHRPHVILHYTIKPNIYGSIAARLAGIPVINNVCGLGTVFMKKNLVSKIATWLYKVSFRYPEKIFFQNQSDLDLFLKNKMVREEVADLVPGSGINLAQFPPCEFSVNKNFTFLMISRLIIDKGIYEYIDAIRHLKNEGISARFCLLGALDEAHSRGIKKSELDGWIRDGLVDYLGHTEDVRPYIQSADCIVLPSYREGTPRTLLEAASSSRPIIATRVPGCQDVVEHNYNGLLCNLQDAEDLARKMKMMIFLERDTIFQWGRNGRKKVELEFNEKFVVDKYMKSISELAPLNLQ